MTSDNKCTNAFISTISTCRYCHRVVNTGRLRETESARESTSRPVVSENDDYRKSFTAITAVVAILRAVNDNLVPPRLTDFRGIL